MLIKTYFHGMLVIVIALSSTIQSLAELNNHHHHHRKLSAAETKLLVDPLEKAKSALNNVLVTIYQRYEYFDNVTENYMLTSANLNKETWDLAKYKFASKFLKSQIKILKSVGSPPPPPPVNSTLRYEVDSYEEDIATRFLMIFSGSSVTAGHDSYYQQSFPMIVKKRFQPVFDALGIKLVVRNIGQGGYMD